VCQYPDAPADVDRAIQALVSAGAAIAVEPGGPGILVGLIRHLGGDRWFWWEAGCESEFGGHVLRGAPEVFYDGLAVKWKSEGSYGYLTTIEESVDGEKEQAQRHAFLKEWQAHLAGNKRVRAFIDRQAQKRTQPDPHP